MNYWQNKVVLITGASSGIGRELALQLAQSGARLALLARRADALQETVSAIEAHGGVAVTAVADVRDAERVRLAIEESVTKIGPLDLLIANAGVAITGHATALSPADIANVISTNVIGAANCVTAVLPDMVERHSGHLVAISSLAGYRGLPKSSAYGASKAAVSSFFESLRLDLTGTGVDVTIIHPGFIKTPLTAGRQAKMPFLMELDDAVKKMIHAMEQRRKSVAFPWPLASLVRLGLIMPSFMYDRIAVRSSFRE
ncbi:MAG: SDR family NAD(P)-dependent oxidoreductase [Pyrinomonadaceae bacterium]